MVNVYVHIEVRGLPVGIVDHDDFLDGVWRELPDCSVSGQGDVVGITLSQFSLTDRRAVRRQIERVRRALTALGWPDVDVRLEEVKREDARDDVSVVTGLVRWHARRLVGRA